MAMLASQDRTPWVVLALAIQLATQVGCDVEPPDAHDDDTDGAVTGAGETLDVWFTSGTDEAGDSSEDGGESGGGSGSETDGETDGETGDEVPPEEPDYSCLENLPAPDSQDKVWIASGKGGIILRSTDGIHWDPLEIGGMARLYESASVGSTFVLADPYDHQLLVSDDGGLTWDLLASGLPSGPWDLQGVGDLFLARDWSSETSYWSADGKIWNEAQGVAPTNPDYAVGPAGILSGFGPDSSVVLSVDGKVWSELLPTMGWRGDNLQHLVGRGDDYLAWPDEYPPSRIYKSVDGLTWTTSHIPGHVPSPDYDTHDVRWNGAQYVMYGSWYLDNGDPWFNDGKVILRSCNGRVWGYGYSPECSGNDLGWCVIDFVSTAAMTVVVLSNYDHTFMNYDGHSRIHYSADLVTWSSAADLGGRTLVTVVVGDP
jgi:hypothetical protein